jgi:hypothetical protein
MVNRYKFSVKIDYTPYDAPVVEAEIIEEIVPVQEEIVVQKSAEEEKQNQDAAIGAKSVIKPMKRPGSVVQMTDK